jgi:SAM-dependent methyltransferase
MLAGTIKDGARFPLSESSVRQYWFMCDGDEEGTDMTDSPRTWHFGLMAQWWAEFNLDAATEVAYLRPLIEDDGQPALDLACGTGRVLLPLLEAGLDVDGCDMSADMLAGCRRRGAQKGLTPNLYAQAMHALDLPRRYRTIYICDSFGIGGQREQDLEALRRCYQQLAPGGLLVFNHYLPYFHANEWQFWLPDNRRQLPEPWFETGTGPRRKALNGDEYETMTRIAGMNPLLQRLTRETRVTLWRGGEMVATEDGTLIENLYFLPELRSLLGDAGFEDVTIYAAYSTTPVTVDDQTVTFVARK